MPTLRQLSYLVALDDEKHFRRAAERVHVTQPTLSVQLQKLEQRLGASLIERSAAHAMLTPLGREIAARARRVLGDVSDIVDLASAAQHGLHGSLKLGVPPTLGPYLLPHVVPVLHESHPSLKLYVKEGKPADLQAELQAGFLDLVVSPLPINQAELEVERLFREPLLIAVARDHPLAAVERIERRDLAGHQVLAIERGHHLHDQVSALCDEFGATLLRDYEGTSLDTLRHMVGMGVGIAFMPALYVRSEIGNRGEVAVLSLKAASLHRQIGLAWRKRAVQAPQFKDLAEMVRDIASNILPEVTVIR